MGRLRATDAAAGPPVTLGAATLSAGVLGRVTSVMPFRGRDDAVRDALGGWPESGQWIAVGAGRLVWSGLGQVLAMGMDVDTGDAALTDQSDAWAAFRLSGAGAEDVLARLSPVDFRARLFPDGSVARTLVENMNVLVLRDADGFVILVFRSMAGSARHALERAMGQVAESCSRRGCLPASR